MTLNKLKELLSNKTWRSLFTIAGIGLIIATVQLITDLIQVRQSAIDKENQKNADATEVSWRATDESYRKTEIFLQEQAVENQKRQLERVDQSSAQVTPITPFESSQTQSSEATQVPGSDIFVRYNIPESDNPQKGGKNAPINIIEFGDFECPFSQRWNNDVLPKLLERFPGQISYTFRDYPLYNIHPNALYAAQTAYCAEEQGNYWNYHDLLFSGRFDLSSLPYDQTINKDASLDQKQYMECMGSDRPFKSVLEDYEFAANLGIRSTPTFFINGIPIVGSLPLEEFVKIIGNELTGKYPK